MRAKDAPSILIVQEIRKVLRNSVARTREENQNTYYFYYKSVS
jgi:hypothetical protein